MADTDNFPQIPGYRVEKKIGRGGMADVYLGLQEALGRQVAIKVLNPTLIKDKQLLQRFLNEARTASQLEHPNIVTIHDVGQVNDRCFIVMEYLQDSLVERIKFSPSLRIERKEAFRILRQVTRALAYAHKAGIIHRDIKPDNILFRKDNTPVLVDFGIAREVNSDSRLTTVGMIIGTPHYMSPEQCRGEKIDGRSDIYSLGAVFYEMLTGDIPFKADSAAGILVKHIQDPIPQLPYQLHRYQPLLERMMAKKREDRVQNCEELLTLTEHFIADSPLDTIETTRPDQYVFSSNASQQNHFDGPEADSQPTILAQTRTQRPTHKSRAFLLYLLAFLIIGVGGYMGYYHLIKPRLEPIPGTVAEKPSDEIIDVNEDMKLPGTQKLDKQSEGNTAAVADKTLENSNMPSNSPSGNQDHKESGESTSSGQTPTDNFNVYLEMAQEYFNDGDIQKAQQKLAEATAIKSTPEAEALQKQIQDKINAQKDQEYMGYLSQALAQLKKDRFDKAREYLTKARKIKTTGDLDKINRQIQQKEQAAKAAARRKKVDDEAFKTAQSANSIFSYEKYLKKYPRGLHADEANNKLDQLKSATTLEIKIKDDVSFETASSKNTIESFEAYLKEFPYGQHVEKAKKKIQELKDHLVQITTEKIQFQQLRFFQSGSKALPVEQRQYANRFSQADTRYIYIELKYRNVLYRIAESNNQVEVRFEGPFTQQIKGVISPFKEARDGIYSRGMGWPEPGKWPKGSFTVTVLIEGKQAGNAKFEIY